MWTPIRFRRLLGAAALVAALVLAGCAEDEPAVEDEDVAVEDEDVDEPDEPEEDAAEEDAEDADEPEEADEPDDGDGPASVALSDEGFLVDGDDMTLYLFTDDEDGQSTCYDDCEANWPPLLTDGDPDVGDDLDADLIGTTTRDDDTTQVTYNDWPLYYWIGDEAPGDVEGQGVGDVWYVLDAGGEAITDLDAADAADDDDGEDEDPDPSGGY